MLNNFMKLCYYNGTEPYLLWYTYGSYFFLHQRFLIVLNSGLNYELGVEKIKEPLHQSIGCEVLTVWVEFITHDTSHHHFWREVFYTSVPCSGSLLNGDRAGWGTRGGVRGWGLAIPVHRGPTNCLYHLLKRRPRNLFNYVMWNEPYASSQLYIWRYCEKGIECWHLRKRKCSFYTISQ